MIEATETEKLDRALIAADFFPVPFAIILCFTSALFFILFKWWARFKSVDEPRDGATLVCTPLQVIEHQVSIKGIRLGGMLRSTSTKGGKGEQGGIIPLSIGTWQLQLMRIGTIKHVAGGVGAMGVLRRELSRIVLEKTSPSLKNRSKVLQTESLGFLFCFIIGSARYFCSDDKLVALLC